MGVRIAALWKGVDEGGTKRTTGKLSSPCGINLPPNQPLNIAVVHNDKKVEGDKQPDAFIEVWTPKN
jgi:hypothetical protein